MWALKKLLPAGQQKRGIRAPASACVQVGEAGVQSPRQLLRPRLDDLVLRAGGQAQALEQGGGVGMMCQRSICKHNKASHPSLQGTVLRASPRSTVDCCSGPSISLSSFNF